MVWWHGMIVWPYHHTIPPYHHTLYSYHQIVKKIIAPTNGVAPISEPASITRPSIPLLPIKPKVTPKFNESEKNTNGTDWIHYLLGQIPFFRGPVAWCLTHTCKRVTFQLFLFLHPVSTVIILIVVFDRYSYQGSHNGPHSQRNSCHTWKVLTFQKRMLGASNLLCLYYSIPEMF